ncbi:MAG: hypothetical protein J6A54_06515 [Clostridia bacterium]|nr:hypothetical protein [Clostridia bacterium]
MKKKILLSLLAIILAVACAVCIVSCKKDPDESESSSGETPGETPGLTVGAAIPRYLRVVDFTSDSATLKFNLYSADTDINFDIRYSDKEITEANFDKATTADYELSGDAEKTLKVKGIAPSSSKACYVAVKSTEGMDAVRVGGANEQVKIDYAKKITAVYHGETNKDLSALFDEQTLANAFIFPKTNLGELMTNKNDVEEGKQGMNISPIIDLEYPHYVSKVSAFYIFEQLLNKGTAVDNIKLTVRWSTKPVDFMATDDKWDGATTLTKDDILDGKWNDVEIGATVRYIQFVFKDGYAPNEFFVYGYQKGEGDKIATTLHKLPTVGEVLGMCGFTANGGGNTTTEQLACVSVLREYHNMGWSYTATSYPGKANNYVGANGTGNFDSKYKDYSRTLTVIPCVQWTSLNVARSVNEDGLPIPDTKNPGNKFQNATYFEKFDPRVYFLYADNMFWFAARYGSNKSADLLKTLQKSTLGAVTETGLGYIQWLEFGNEPNGEDALGYVPYQLAALQSASYDGHQKTLTSSQVENKGYHFGSKNADPNMKVAISGLAGIQGKYIVSMVYWMKANRTDGDIAMDAFNFHSYFGRPYYMNGTEIYMGVCPEFFGIVDEMAPIIEFRNKYYPDKEVWITEFGWDTNQSYETMTACHAYNVTDLDKDGDIDEDDKFARVHQIQGDWLVRAYILFASCGIDKATMYMCEDTTSDERTTSGKYGTCGIFGLDAKGNPIAKDAYYYLYTLKNTLGGYTFSKEIATGNDDVWLYEFKNAEGKTAYAVWCPTMDGTTVDNFEIAVSGSSAKAVTLVDNDTDGVSTNLTVNGGKIKVNVSESPTMIIVD